MRFFLRLFLRFVRFEAGLWRSLFLLVTGRVDGMRPGVTAIGYHRAATPLWVIALFGTCVEIPAVHLIVPWAPVRAALVVVGVWGVLLVAGMWASYRVRPYLVDDAGIRLRMGPARDITVPWSQVTSIEGRTIRTWENAGFGTAALQEGTRLAYVVNGQTTVVIHLSEPLGEVTEIHVGADNPAELLNALALRI
jgi:hypothetical protein